MARTIVVEREETKETKGEAGAEIKVEEAKASDLVDIAAVERPSARGEITIDSGAEESVWPISWTREDELEAPSEGVKIFRTASGTEMRHYGQKTVYFKVPGDGDARPKCIKFQVTDVVKPLVAVSRVAQMGHAVSFGPKAEDNHIVNKKTGEAMAIRRKRGGYVLDVEFLDVVNGPEQGVFAGRV